MARRVQQGLLTDCLPSIPGVPVAAKCKAADSVGGDFFNFIHQSLSIPLTM